MLETEEQWKLIPGLFGRGRKDTYEISDLGRVRHSVTKEIEAISANTRGYVLFKGLRVHRLVAEAFIPNPENKPEVNHKLGIKDDNRAIELEWATGKENMRHAFDTGLIVPLKGEAKPNSTLTEEAVLQIRHLAATQDWTNQQLADYLGRDRSHVRQVVDFLTWRHVGNLTEEQIQAIVAERAERIKFAQEEVLVERGKCRAGKLANGAILTAELVENFRHQAATTSLTDSELASQIGCDRRVMRAILNYESWQHTSDLTEDQIKEVMSGRIERLKLVEHANRSRATSLSKAKLTEQQALQARRLHETGKTTTQIAKEFGVSMQIILRVVKRQTWRHV